MEEPRQSCDWRERGAKLFCLATAGLFAWLLLRYATSAVVVMLIAWGVASVIAPLARRTEQALRIPRKLCAAVYVLLLLAALGGIVFFCVDRLLAELGELLEWTQDNQAWLGERFDAFWARASAVASRIPIFGDRVSSAMGDSIRVMAQGWLGDGLATLGTWLTARLGTLLGAIPRLLILLLLTVTACFYWSMDYDRIRDFLLSLLPSRKKEAAERLRGRVGRALRAYLRAYLLILLLTWAEVFAGLLILGQPYALLIGLGVAIVDLLPIFGAGTVLLPWAVVQLLLKQYSMGVGLLILYGVITIVRQLVEPRIVGGSLGVHPLAVLFFALLGLQLLGFFGVLLAPAAALLAKELLAGRDSRSV